MKKKLLFIMVFMLFCAMFAVSSSAERFTNQPVTLAIADGEQRNAAGEYAPLQEDVYLTITDMEITTPYYFVESENTYMKNLGVYIDGTVSHVNSRLDLVMHCYDKNGNWVIDYDFGFSPETASFNGIFMDVLIGADMDIASVEFAAKTPGGWDNSYYYYRYENVYADDGRVMGVHELLVPNYELVGWHGNVVLYSLDGREIEVPYPDVSAYKKVGWYDWDEKAIILFREDFKENLAAGDYDIIIDDANWLLGWLETDRYVAEVKALRKQAIDAWRKEEGGVPLATLYDIENNEDGTADIIFWMYNLSDKPIVAFRMEFSCHDIFGRTVDEVAGYYSDSEYIEPGQYSKGTWSLDSVKTDYIGNYKMNQVVFSDRTSWFNK